MNSIVTKTTPISNNIPIKIQECKPYVHYIMGPREDMLRRDRIFFINSYKEACFIDNLELLPINEKSDFQCILVTALELRYRI